VEFGGYGEGAAQDSNVYHRARPTRAPSALLQAQRNAVDNEAVERFGAQRHKK
jgi:hypothetical protein